MILIVTIFVTRCFVSCKQTQWRKSLHNELFGRCNSGMLQQFSNITESLTFDRCYTKWRTLQGYAFLNVLISVQTEPFFYYHFQDMLHFVDYSWVPSCFLLCILHAICSKIVGSSIKRVFSNLISVYKSMADFSMTAGIVRAVSIWFVFRIPATVSVVF